MIRTLAGALLAAGLAVAMPAAATLPASACYQGREIRVEVPGDGITLAGDLTLPRGKGPFPVVQMITGSGPHTREQRISDSPMFTPIAQYLARRGVAVLRSDARGFGGSTGTADYEAHTTAERTRDNRALLAYLREQPSLDLQRVGLLGHSEGAMIAAILGGSEDGLALVVLVAPSTLPGRELLADQLSGNLGRRGASADTVARVREALLAFFDYLASGRDDDAEFTVLARRFLAAHGVPMDQVQDERARSLLSGYLASRWDRYFAGYDPAPDLRRIEAPVLAIYGDKDQNVPWRQHLPRLVDSLAHGASTGFETVVLPDTDHYFLEFEGKRLEKHRPGEMQVSSRLLAVLDAALSRRGWLRPACTSD